MTTEQRIAEFENGRTFEVMTHSDLEEYMNNLNNGSHTKGSIVTLTIPKMNKTGNPYWGRVTKLSKWNFGCNTAFSTKGDNLRERTGIEGDFTANKSYVTADKKNFVVCSKDDDPNTKYLRVYTDANGDEVSFSEYYIDNVKATEFEVEQLKTFLVKSSKGSHNLGIKGDEAFGTFNVGMNSVKYIFVMGRKIKVVK